MRIFKSVLFILFILLGVFERSSAQMICGSDPYNRNLLKDQSLLARSYQIKESWISYNRKASKAKEDVYTLPVVFHIIHKKGSDNIPDAQVLEAFRILNDGFANTAEFDQGSGVDTRIKFCLAKKDPEGNYTTGITHTYADYTRVSPLISGMDLFLKSLINWDPTQYINIWVIEEVDY